MKETLKEIEANRARFQVESGIDHAGTYFGKIHKQFTSENKLVEFQQYNNTDSQISLLWVDDKIAAFVIEARSAFNHVEVVKGTACATICEEQEKNTAVAFLNFTTQFSYSNAKKVWVRTITGEHFQPEQLFRIFKEQQNGKPTK